MVAGLILFAAILVVVGIICLTVWATMTKKYDDNPLEEIQRLSDRAAALADTALLYQRMGMEKEAQEALDESERLNTQVWEVINGANK